MSFLQNLFSNDKMKDMAFSLVKKQMKENDVKYFVLDLMDNGELDLLPYHASQKPVIVSQEQMNTLQTVLETLEGRAKELEAQVDKAIADNVRLAEMCAEQERVHSQYAEENARLREENEGLKENGLFTPKTIPYGDDSNAEAGQPV